MSKKSKKNRKKSANKPKVNQLFDHLVWHTKYNRKVLVGDEIRSETERIVREVLDELECEVVEINIQPNHVHVLFEFPTSLPLSKVAQKVKSTTSFILRRDFPELVKAIPNALWSPSSCHTTVGAEKHVVVRYIRNQDKHANEDKKTKRERWRRRWYK